jgi:LPXTG-motif cell wall-anchored protein
MQIFDLFSGNTGNQNNGAASLELPSDGATSNQTRSIFEGLSNAVDGISGVYNSFNGKVEGGKAKQTVAMTGTPPTNGMQKSFLLLIGAAVAAVALWFLLKKKG